MIELFMLFSGYVLCYFFFKNSAIGMINEVKTNFNLFPKYYCLPPRWMRKHFNLKNKKIPQYLCFRLYVSIAFGLLAPVTTIIGLCTQFNNIVIGIILFAPSFFVLPDTIQFIILSHIFKKK